MSMDNQLSEIDLQNNCHNKTISAWWDCMQELINNAKDVAARTGVQFDFSTAVESMYADQLISYANQIQTAFNQFKSDNAGTWYLEVELILQKTCPEKKFNPPGMSFIDLYIHVP